jgi:hypothetical protein
MVFNIGITPFPLENTMSDDKKLIEDLGGPTKLCELLGYEKHGGVQRVQNWLVRGIPPKVKLERPDLFLIRTSSSGDNEPPVLAPELPQ